MWFPYRNTQLHGLLPLLLLLISGYLPFQVYENRLHTARMGPLTGITLYDEIGGDITPKSIAHSGNGRFFAQNMMYRHSVTVYDRNRQLIKTISDKISLASYGYHRFPENATYQGSPVECAFSHSGRYAWVTNYEMSGPGLQNPGNDQCLGNQGYDSSFVYKINTQSLEIEQVIQVGCVPKFVAASPDDRYVLVTNWCSGDLTVIDTRLNYPIQTLFLGSYPRGIVVDAESRYAYITLMGETRIAVVRLSDFSVSYLEGVGITPRHLCITTSGQYLFVSLSRPGQVLKMEINNPAKRMLLNTGAETRSMVLDPSENYLYVVSYEDNRLTKVRVKDMAIVHQVTTGSHPIGVTFDESNQMIWVACYSGKIQLFKDWDYPTLPAPPKSTYPYIARPDPQATPSAPKTYQIPLPGGLTPNHQPAILRPDVQTAPSATVQPSRPPKPAESATIPEDKPPGNARYLPESVATGSQGVVVGSFSQEENARTYVVELQQMGCKGAQVIALPNGSFRVIAGRYARRSEAEQVMAWFRQQLQPNAWIVDL